MGDVAITVPLIQGFLKQHPNIKVTVVSKPFLKPLFKDIENLSFFSVKTKGRHRGFIGLFRLFLDLKKRNPTHFADLHNVLRSKIVRLYFSLLTNVSIAKIDKGRKEKKALTRKKNKVFKPLKTSIERYATVFNELGFKINLNSIKSLEKKALDNETISLVGKKKSIWIGIAPFAAFNSKTYPLDLMKQVVASLSQNNFKVLLFGGKSDVEILTTIESENKNVLSVAGKLNGLKNELDLISNLDLMLSMDSANAHLAAMYNVTTITIWGNTHPYAGFAPFNQPESHQIVPNMKKYPLLPCSIYGNKVFEGYEDVMRNIEPSTIINKIKIILKNKSTI